MNLREKIIRDSLRLFSLKGFLNTSILDILDKTQASKGGLYNHFKSKEDLFFAVLSEARRLWREKNLSGLDQIGKPVQKVKKLLKNYFIKYLQDKKNFPGGCFFVTMSVELDDQRPHLAKELNEGFKRLKAMFIRLLEEGKGSGEIRADVNTEEATELIFSAILGASVMYGTSKSAATLRRIYISVVNYLDGLAP
ncbi:MAG: TetR/AcrR family transcriptional regulator [Pseudomonadota bacterium]